ncbi:MAG TPA: hypothetical protein VIF62_03910 [Labilithrix sp.]|jgi:hypothetical protein
MTMLRKKLWLMLCSMMVVAGCGASAEKAPAQTPNGGFAGNYPSSAPAETSVGSGGSFNAQPGVAPAPPPASAPAGDAKSSSTPSARRESAEPTPQQRPGLGTEWGEARTSRVHDVTFVRESSRPFALASLNYDDRRGVDALASREARKGPTFRSIESGGGAVSVSIRDASGDALEALKVGDRTFVIGQAGQRYSIVLTNHTSHRFEAVATVDGLDVINGKDGSFDNRGYVLMPFATLEIEGFRQSTSAVAAFRFASVPDSYAQQMGKGRNIGVIGVAFFGERGDSFVPESETRTRDTASPFPADPRFAPPPPR